MSLGLARARVWSVAFACTVIGAAPVAAQGWNYPSFNHPQIMSREFNFALADGGDYGTALVFQWREGFGIRTELKFDVGVRGSRRERCVFIAGAASDTGWPWPLPTCRSIWCSRAGSMAPLAT